MHLKRKWPQPLMPDGLFVAFATERHGSPDIRKIHKTCRPMAKGRAVQRAKGTKARFGSKVAETNFAFGTYFGGRPLALRFVGDPERVLHSFLLLSSNAQSDGGVAPLSSGLHNLGDNLTLRS